MHKIVTYSAAFSLLTLLAGGPAAAQAKSDPAPGSSTKPAKHSATMISDTVFARRAAEGGLAEVKLGQLAEEKGSSQDVKDFGKRMVADYTKANEELKDDAAKQKITLPSTMSRRDQMAYDHLSKLSGKAFDRAYARDMVRDHRIDAAEFLHEGKNGHQDWAKGYALQTLPTIREQMKQAEQMLHTVEPTKSSKS
jgi:putative membrane protein